MSRRAAWRTPGSPSGEQDREENGPVAWQPGSALQLGMLAIGGRWEEVLTLLAQPGLWQAFLFGISDLSSVLRNQWFRIWGPLGRR
jgi:hypothetical protein